MKTLSRKRLQKWVATLRKLRNQSTDEVIRQRIQKQTRGLLLDLRTMRAIERSYDPAVHVGEVHIVA